MTRLFKILILILISINALASCMPKTKDVSAETEKENYLYLVAGLDEAAENTDVLMTLSFSKDESLIRIAQIPRDTYYAFGGAQNKINQLFASLRAKGNDRDEALAKVASALEESFGVNFDGCVGVSIGTFKKLVDCIGGVDIDIPEDMNVSLDEDEKKFILKKGINHIDGELAERFVRYRSGYKTGDLGRIDAQKIFINAIFKKLSGQLTLPKIVEIINVFRSDLFGDIRFSDMFSLFSNIIGKNDLKISYVTMPGESIQNENKLSFYVLNRKSAAEIVNIYMFANKEFDKDRKFLSLDEIGFSNIYFDDGYEIKEYTDENLSGIKIY